MNDADFHLRPYRASDYDWVLDCEVALQTHERTLSDTRLPGLPHTHDYLTLLFETLAEFHGLLLIAERDGVRVGLVAGHVLDQPWPMETADSTRCGYVSDIFIVPEQRGTGLAGILLDAMAQHFRDLGQDLRRLRINALAANQLACKAYVKAGFAPYEVMFERML
ncbi:GNAT family N-acetyltransferase [Dongia mobilis]|jgi:GNAT superfamily N-acetyltransferase|uniref:GNAT family N-acetyltransferase n=1 Tax=Dongia sp. TaxID=1977262 RepID=UPI0026EFC3B7